MCLELAGITCRKDGFHGPLGGACSSGGCCQALGLELTLPPCSPQENGAESQSVSESPPSPAAPAVSPCSSESRSQVGLGVLGEAVPGKQDLG